MDSWRVSLGADRLKAWDWLLGSRAKCDRVDKCLEEEEWGAIRVLCWTLSGSERILLECFLSHKEEKPHRAGKADWLHRLVLFLPFFTCHSPPVPSARVKGKRTQTRVTTWLNSVTGASAREYSLVQSDCGLKWEKTGGWLTSSLQLNCGCQIWCPPYCFPFDLIKCQQQSSRICATWTKSSDLQLLKCFWIITRMEWTEHFKGLVNIWPNYFASGSWHFYSYLNLSLDN